MALKTYNFAQVSVIVAGNIISGFGDGDVIKVERNEDSFMLFVGAEGEATRSKVNNKSGKVTLTLQQSAESNAILSGLLKADELANNGLFPLLIKDNSGNSLYAAEQAWVLKAPAATFGKESGSREWVIETDNLQMFDGGN